MPSMTTLLPKLSTARCAAVLGLAGTVFLSLVPAASVHAADPPSWSPAWGQRNKDDHKNDRRDDKKDEQRDKKNNKIDVRQLRRDQGDLRNDRRSDDRNDRYNDRNNDRNSDRYNNNSRYDRYNRDNNNNSRYDRNNDGNNAPYTNNNRDDQRNNGSFRDRFEQARQQDANRQKTKSDWRNLTILGGAATVYGLLKHDPTVTFIGAAGTLYSASRYEQDRKSQSQTDRARAEVFDRGSFDRDGVQYTKRDKWVNGQHYYYFTR